MFDFCVQLAYIFQASQGALFFSDPTALPKDILENKVTR